MATRKSFRRNPTGVSQFDDGVGAASSWRQERNDVPISRAGSERELAVIPKGSQGQRDMLFDALLKHLCDIYIQDRPQSQKLFEELSQKLMAPGIMTHKKGLSCMRRLYAHKFFDIVDSAMNSLRKRGILVARGLSLQERALEFLRPHMKPVQVCLPDTGSIQTSRYKQDFNEVDMIGSGGYGKVFKVTHNMDRHSYAIKRIQFMAPSVKVFQKMMREVENLAALNHPNVVRYHGAWLEESTSPVTSDSEVSDSSSLQHSDAAAYPDFRPRRCAANEESPGVISTFGSEEVFEDELESNKSETCPKEENKRGQGARPKFYRSASSPAKASYSNPRKGDDDNCALVPTLPTAVTRDVQALFPGFVLNIQMELCKETLSDWLNTRNYLARAGKDSYSAVDKKKNSQLFLQILNGLSYIHEEKFIHRDLKPQNIFLTSKRKKLVVKLGDFGLCRKTSMADPDLTPDPGGGQHMHLTRDVGTAIYAAPEQLKGSEYDFKADMYSLGVILFELYEPFGTGMERSNSLRNLGRNDIPKEFTKHWPKQSKIVKRLIHRDPAQRPSTKDLLQDENVSSKDSIIAHLRRKLRKQDAEIERLKSKVLKFEQKAKNGDIKEKQKQESYRNIPLRPHLSVLSEKCSTGGSTCDMRKRPETLQNASEILPKTITEQQVSPRRKYVNKFKSFSSLHQQNPHNKNSHPLEIVNEDAM